MKNLFEIAFDRIRRIAFKRIRRLNSAAPWEASYNTSATYDDIYYCFRILLGRTPHEEEWGGHCSRVGYDLNAVVGSYINSLEFSQRLEKLRLNNLDDSIFLTKFNGFSIYAQENDLAVGRSIVVQGQYEPHVTKVFREFVKPSMHILDVGANIGYYSMLSASLVGEKGKVIAIEPNPKNVKLIEASRRANRFENISIMQLAAGRERGILVINSSGSNGTTYQLSDDFQSLLESTTVASMKIDEIVTEKENVDLIKIDIEGAEYNALTGASSLIKRCKPLIISEFSPESIFNISKVEGREYLKFLVDFDYEISVIERDGRITKYAKDTGQSHEIMVRPTREAL